MVPGGSAAPVKSLIGTFVCGVSLAIQNITGSISEYLDCTPSDLEEYGWRPFLHPHDRDVIFRMAQELQIGRAGSYDCRAQARVGEPILHIRVRTLAVSENGLPCGAEGMIDLRHVESRRTIVLP
jgi:hypothetical protein